MFSQVKLLFFSIVHNRNTCFVYYGFDRWPFERLLSKWLELFRIRKHSKWSARLSGPVAIPSVMVSAIAFMSIMGGSLSADLKVFSIIGPLILIGATVPRLVSEVSQIAGAVVVCVFRHKPSIGD